MADLSANSDFMLSDEFRIGAVVGRSISIFWRHLAAFVLMAGIIFLPSLVVGLLEAPAAQDLQHHITQGQHVALVQPARTASGLANIASLLTSILTVMVQGVISHYAFAVMVGSDVDIGASFRVGVSRFWPMFGAGLLMGFGIVFGLILLVVPGLILAAMWFVATPACVVERLGPIDSLNRSAELTKGHRWKILAIVISFLISVLIVAALPGGIIVAMGGSPVAILIWVYVLQTLYVAGSTILGAVIYHDLRTAREGLGIERLTAVFD